MAFPTEADILKALRTVKPAWAEQDIVTLHMVSGIAIKAEAKGCTISFTLEVDPKHGEALDGLQRQAQHAVEKLPGVVSTTVVMTAHKTIPRRGPAKILIEGIKHIVAVASGKGGVGKSTTAVNLAMAMAVNGLRTGLLDADIYGPSVPRLTGLSGKPQITDDKKLVPLDAHGVAVMSIGFLVAEESPMVWRGPMVQSALMQMLRGVVWGERDILVVDMPPGTGDVQLTMAQQVPLSGAVVVSTPQDIALLDARKGIGMFGKVEVPILGIIENMSYFLCPHCGGRSDIFSHGGAQAEAVKLKVPFLGEMPLGLAVRETSDAGTPIVMAAPESAEAASYRAMAAKIWQAVEHGGREAPRIVMG